MNGLSAQACELLQYFIGEFEKNPTETLGFTCALEGLSPVLVRNMEPLMQELRDFKLLADSEAMFRNRTHHVWVEFSPAGLDYFKENEFIRFEDTFVTLITQIFKEIESKGEAEDKERLKLSFRELQEIARLIEKEGQIPQRRGFYREVHLLGAQYPWFLQGVEQVLAKALLQAMA